ncbi:unnamed protein product, partial [Closterium sp. Naga37s-1]
MFSTPGALKSAVSRPLPLPPLSTSDLYHSTLLLCCPSLPLSPPTPPPPPPPPSPPPSPSLPLPPLCSPYQRSIRELASALSADATSLEGVAAARLQLGEEATNQKLFGAARMSAMLIDDGLKGGVAHNGDVNWGTGGGESGAYEPVVAFKSIAAYRCGLSIDPIVTPSEVDLGLQATLASVVQTCPPSLRLCDPRVISFCIATARAVAAKHQLPLQIHCGFGDRDLDLAAANPLCLRALLEFNEGLVEVPVGEVPVGDATVGEAHGEARGVGRSYASYAAPIVLLHSCYPFMRETSYLASVYSTVYVDCGLVFSKLSLSGMKAALLDLLDLAPLNKVIMSTDAVGFAEPYYL